MQDQIAPKVGILTGSPNDLPTVEKAGKVLDQLGIAYEVKVMSAHRTPGLVMDYVKAAPERGIKVLVACAGLANHLAGTVAAHTLLPVIGVPLTSGPMGGLDALLSTVQMPPGIPVATVRIDGARNAAFLAARILALGDSKITRALQDHLDSEKLRYEGYNQ